MREEQSENGVMKKIYDPVKLNNNNKYIMNSFIIVGVLRKILLRQRTE